MLICSVMIALFMSQSLSQKETSASPSTSSYGDRLRPRKANLPSSEKVVCGPWSPDVPSCPLMSPTDPIPCMTHLSQDRATWPFSGPLKEFLLSSETSSDCHSVWAGGQLQLPKNVAEHPVNGKHNPLRSLPREKKGNTHTHKGLTSKAFKNPWRIES